MFPGQKIRLTTQNRNIMHTSNILNGHSILVVGSSEGIGREAALTYARAGAKLMTLARNTSALEQLKRQIIAEGLCSPTIFQFDLESKNEDEYRQLAQHIEAESHTLDGALLNASLLGARTTLADYPWDTWQQVMQVNVNAQFLLVKHLLSLLQRSSTDASLVLTTSSVGRQGRAEWGAYSVSKFATEALMQICGQEVGENSPVRINCINPGSTRTAMRAAAYPEEDPSSVRTPADIMDLYLHLMSPESSDVRGQSIDAQNWNRQKA